MRPFPAHEKFPGALNAVLLVGAVGPHLHEADFSHYGHRIDVFAPGVDVWGASPRKYGPPFFSTGSGTSYSAPIVCGLALRKLSQLDAQMARTAQPPPDMAALKDCILEGARQGGKPDPSTFVCLAKRLEDEQRHWAAPLAPALETRDDSRSWWGFLWSLLGGEE